MTDQLLLALVRTLELLFWPCVAVLVVLVPAWMIWGNHHV